MHKSEFYQKAQEIFAFKLPEGTLLDLYRLAGNYAASTCINDDRMVGNEYKSRIYNSYLTKEGFKDDSWPNYEGWLKEYETFNLLVHMQSRDNGNYLFGITTANKGINSASDAHGINKHMFHPLAESIDWEGLKQSITFFNSMFIKK